MNKIWYQRRCSGRGQSRWRGRVREDQLRKVLLVEGDRVYALRVLRAKVSGQGPDEHQTWG